MRLQLLAPDLGVIDHPLTVRGLALGTRTTVVRRPDAGGGGVVLISPGPLDDDATAAIAALGPVRAIVAPNLMHDLFLPAAMARFPGAPLYAHAALAARHGLTVAGHGLTVAGPPRAVADAALVAIDVGGMPKLQETLFVHRPSRTLVATDLVFNLRAPAPWFTRTFMRCNGGFDRFGPTRICRSLVKDRAAVRTAVERALDENFDRVVVAHGQVLPSGGREALRAGFAWLLDAAAPAAPAAATPRDTVRSAP
jgi:hypothetical protein